MLILLRFILIVFLVVFLLAFVSRLFLRSFFKRMEKKFNASAGQTRNPRPEGEVYVSKSPKTGKKVDQNVGDYVDYEEVD